MNAIHNQPSTWLASMAIIRLIGRGECTFADLDDCAHALNVIGRMTVKQMTETSASSPAVPRSRAPGEANKDGGPLESLRQHARAMDRSPPLQQPPLRQFVND